MNVDTKAMINTSVTGKAQAKEDRLKHDKNA